MIMPPRCNHLPLTRSSRCFSLQHCKTQLSLSRLWLHRLQHLVSFANFFPNPATSFQPLVSNFITFFLSQILPRPTLHERLAPFRLLLRIISGLLTISWLVFFLFRFFKFQFFILSFLSDLGLLVFSITNYFWIFHFLATVFVSFFSFQFCFNQF